MLLSVYDNLLNLERDIDELFSGFPAVAPTMRTREVPAIDVTDTDHEVILSIEMPGVRREDVKLSLHNNLLTISGERKPVSVPEGATWIRNESWTGAFSRSIELPRQLKADGISAELVNGVLFVTLPKAEEARPREISIR